MDHKTMKEKLFALYDSELDAASREELESHLAVCLECRERYERWARTAKVLFQASKLEPSEFFVRRVMSKIHEIEEPKRVINWNISLRWLVPAVGLAFLFMFAVLPSPQAVSMDAFLFQAANGHLSWALSNNVPSADETLQLVMEGQQ